MATSPHPRLVSIGETMALVAPARAEPLGSAVDFRVHVGGAESNVAVHVARFGISAAWVSAVGDDALGMRVMRHIANAGVDVTHVLVDATAPTGVYFKDPGGGVLYYRRGSAASRLSADSIGGVPLEQSEVVHISGITPALSDSAADLIETVVARVRASRAVLSFDVNYRAALWSRDDAAPALLALARRADLVFVGLDEARVLWGTITDADVRALLPEPTILVVKDGGVGATEYRRERGGGDHRTFVPALRVEVVEAVGAGDAFAAGYLAARMAKEASADPLLTGHQFAARVLQSTNDDAACEHEK